MIRAIIFDCFGVLCSDGWLPFRDKHFGSDLELLEQSRDLNRSVDAGITKYDDFIKKVAEMAGVDETEAKKDIESNIPDNALFTYISEKLKDEYKIGMLSNAAKNWLGDIFLNEQIELFDAIALSFETGVIKPNVGAYQIIATKLGILPNECIFIDDQPKYCEGASNAGMVAIQYKNLDQMKMDLSHLIDEKF